MLIITESQEREGAIVSNVASIPYQTSEHKEKISADLSVTTNF